MGKRIIIKIQTCNFTHTVPRRSKKGTAPSSSRSILRPDDNSCCGGGDGAAEISPMSASFFREELELAPVPEPELELEELDFVRSREIIIKEN